MSVDGFPSIMIPLEQQRRANPSVQSIWPRKQASSPETKLLNFQTAELHILLEAICALNPSLQVSRTDYTSPINFHSPRHDFRVDNACGPSPNQMYLRRYHSVTQHRELCSSDPHTLSMTRARLPGSGFGHSWEPSPTAIRCDNRQIKSISSLQSHTLPPSGTNPSNSPSQSSADANLFNNETSSGPKGHVPLKQHLTYWPKKSRKKKTWLTQKKTSKTLDTIPENQEWKMQERYPQDIMTSVLPENSEPRSVFENDSDSEDEIED
ncbi:hypothetical protein PGT21_034776 [Puccinia graminis f. sp. tritici]|uniref:Uncharacterized protein n=1 Tax=Puccinia graminis f. sp. tritici TaxID=56615 RepID=A0A5B0N9A9_PUCGR|nr:hypothetical protein PGTUg99_020182 [Puccinia graminis f. sp. tritici]KAA1084720.1 hypothetical protein PGT21_034776 [Puccinia graminis f. sp. tritici]